MVARILLSLTFLFVFSDGRLYNNVSTFFFVFGDVEADNLLRWQKRQKIQQSLILDITAREWHHVGLLTKFNEHCVHNGQETKTMTHHWPDSGPVYRASSLDFLCDLQGMRYLPHPESLVSHSERLS